MPKTLARIALLAASIALTSCGTSSKPHADLQIAPKRISAELCAKAAPKPVMPATAGIPVAVTPEEKSALSDFLNYVASVVGWGDDLAKRADKTAASEVCR